MLGVTQQDGSYVNGTNFRRDGSLLSGSNRGSSFQRGGSMRGSDRSMRRDIDDIALSNHFSISGSRSFTMPAAQQPLTGYGRKEMDDMVLFFINIVLISDHLNKAVIKNNFSVTQTFKF